MLKVIIFIFHNLEMVPVRIVKSTACKYLSRYVSIWLPLKHLL